MIIRNIFFLFKLFWLNSKKLTNKKYQNVINILYSIILIIIICIFIIFIFNKRSNYGILNLLFFIKKSSQLYSNEINYKGKKILKSKLLENYLSGIPDIYISEKNAERKRFYERYYLADYSTESTIKKLLKSKFLDYISKKKHKKITQLDIFYLNRPINFGNNILALSNAIFYCEVVGCHTILLNKKKLKLSWLISKRVYIRKSNITILLGSNIDCNNQNILCFHEISWSIFYPQIIKPQLRTEEIKKEILRNLPKVNIHPNDLYIHIRGGDIFKGSFGKNFAQPPLCYYEKILNNNKTFKTVYIIAMDHRNIVLDALLKKHKYIIYKKNNLKYDISLLCHAFNIVASVSSFVFSAIKLNDNLKNLWEFDMIRLSNKFVYFHHHIFHYKINYKIYTMEPSEIYRKKMFSFKRTKEQLKLMLEDKCSNNFIRTK